MEKTYATFLKMHVQYILNMKTLHIAMIAILLFSLTMVSSNYRAYAPIPEKSTAQLYNESAIVVVGNIVSAHEIQNGNRTEYVIQPQEYLKPTTYENLTQTIVAQGIGSTSNHMIYFDTYSVGDRALFFLQKEDDYYLISQYTILTKSNCDGKQLLALNSNFSEFSISQGNNTYERMFVNEPINITGYVHNYSDLKSRYMELNFTVHTPQSNVILTEKRQVHIEECKGYAQSTWSFIPTVPGKYAISVDVHDENGTKSGGGSFCCIMAVNRNESTTSHFAIGTPLNLNSTSPLHQFKMGITANNVVCKEGFTRVIKSEDGSPACVKPDTSNMLVEHEWAQSITK